MTTEKAEPPARCDAQSVWEPTEAQLNSACLSYDHSFGMMPEDERNMLRFQAREWLLAWQKEGAGADRREIIDALTRPPSERPVALVEENNQLRAEIKILKRKLATETDRADGFLLAAQVLAGGTDHR